MTLTPNNHPLTDVIYWKNPTISGGVLALSLLYWVVVNSYEYTVVTLLMRVLQVALVASGAVSFWNARNSKPSEEKQDYTDYIQSRLSGLVPVLNKYAGEAYSVAKWEDPKKTGVVLASLQIVFWMFCLFDIHSLVFIAVLLLMTVPMGYSMKKKEVDKAVQTGVEQAKVLGHTVNAKIPPNARTFLEKASIKLPDVQTSVVNASKKK